MFSHIYISTDVEAVRAGLWPFSEHTIPLSEIKHHQVLPVVNPRSLGGVGYRRVPGHKVGYLWKAGKGLELRSIHDETTVIVFDGGEDASQTLSHLLA